MKRQRFNWHIWAGFLLSLIALFSYPFVFVRWPVTRDFPWATLLLFVIAVAFLLFGVRRAWTGQKPEHKGGLTVAPSRSSRIVSSIIATLSVLILGFFLFTFFVASRWLPASRGAPQVGQKAPDFTLTDTSDRPLSLSELLSGPLNGSAPRGVLLVFYRGYW